MDSQQPKTKISKRRRKNGKKLPGGKRLCMDNWGNDDDTPRFATVDELSRKQQLVLLEPAPRKPLPLLLLQRELGFSGVCNPRRRHNDFKRKKTLTPTTRRMSKFPAQLQRDLGYSRHWNVLQWQSQILYHSLAEDFQPVQVDNSRPRRGWRPYIQRKIPFTKLETPGDAAILAIDRQGTYSIALVSVSIPDQSPNLAPRLCLSFYGIPSPSVLERKRNERRRDVSPLLQKVTLVSGSSILDSTIVLFSCDWKLGVAFIVDPANNAAEVRASRRRENLDSFEGTFDLGCIVLFSLPRHDHSTVVQTFRAPRVKMASLQSATMRSLLWQANKIPLKDKKSLCESFLDRPCHLLIQDEGNGLRLTWIADSAWREEEAFIKPVDANSSCNSIPTRRDIVSPVPRGKSVWHEAYNDSHTGIIVDATNSQNIPSHRTIAFEAFLNVPLLLGELLLAHSGMTKHISEDDENPYPPHVCNVISVKDGGRTVDLLIVFSSKSTGYGVFVTLDLFTQHYRSNGWMKNNNIDNLAELRNVCNFFAVNHRMKQRKLGPYAVDPNDPGVWGGLCAEKYSHSGYEFERERDLDPAQWKPFADLARQTREEGGAFQIQEANPKRIPYSSLYPDCELITNRNLRTETPVSELTGIKSPLMLEYC